MADKIQFRRDTSANWASVNPILSQGELGLDLTTGQYKIGDGVTAWNSLAYGSLSGEVSGLNFNATTDPAAPTTDAITIYAKSIGGRIMPKWIGVSGVDTPMQPFLAGNAIGYWRPQGNSTAVPGVLGYGALTAVGTATARNVTTSSLFTRMRRLGYVSAATTGSLVSLRQSAAQITLGDGTNGGFMKVCRFGTSDAATVAGARMFVGISSSTSAPTNVEPSTLTNAIGVGHGAADTNLKLYYGGSSAQTPIDLGANFPANTLSADVYELVLFSPPNQNGVVKYRVTRLNTNHVAEGTLPTSNGVNLPATTTLLSYMWAYRTNNATALAVGLDLMSDYIETDY